MPLGGLFTSAAYPCYTTGGECFILKRCLVIRHMARPEKYKVDDVIAAIRQAQTAAGAGRVLGCVSDTIRAYARRYATVDAALRSEREDLIDFAESGLRHAVETGEPWAIAFALKTVGKHRGYTERHEVTGEGGGALTIAIVNVDVDKV